MKKNLLDIAIAIALIVDLILAIAILDNLNNRNIALDMCLGDAVGDSVCVAEYTYNSNGKLITEEVIRIDE